MLGKIDGRSKPDFSGFNGVVQAIRTAFEKILSIPSQHHVFDFGLVWNLHRFNVYT